MDKSKLTKEEIFKIESEEVSKSIEENSAKLKKEKENKGFFKTKK